MEIWKRKFEFRVHKVSTSDYLKISNHITVHFSKIYSNYFSRKMCQYQEVFIKITSLTQLLSYRDNLR